MIFIVDEEKEQSIWCGTRYDLSARADGVGHALLTCLDFGQTLKIGFSSDRVECFGTIRRSIMEGDPMALSQAIKDGEVDVKSPFIVWGAIKTATAAGYVQGKIICSDYEDYEVLKCCDTYGNEFPFWED